MLIKASKRYFSRNTSFDTNDASQIFKESVHSTLYALRNINQVKEFDETLSANEKENLKRFLIYRSNPQDPLDNPHYMSYYLDVKNIQNKYLDALFYIKDNIDSTISFRRSCREGICGSCAMNCDGIQTLACIKNFDRNNNKPTIINPLGHMFILKDLVVDMTNFYAQYKTIQPYLMRKTEKDDIQQEYYQSEEDRKLLDGLYECVLCSCCSTSCPQYWWHPDKYLGPAVLMQAYRWIIDSRDEYTQERLEQLNKIFENKIILDEDIKLSDCQNIGMCSVTCPKGLDPQKAIQNLMKLVKENNQKQTDEKMI